jgi:hypothetical protein
MKVCITFLLLAIVSSFTSVSARANELKMEEFNELMNDTYTVILEARGKTINGVAIDRMTGVTNLELAEIMSQYRSFKNTGTSTDIEVRYIAHAHTDDTDRINKKIGLLSKFHEAKYICTDAQCIHKSLVKRE